MGITKCAVFGLLYSHASKTANKREACEVDDSWDIRMAVGVTEQEHYAHPLPLDGDV